MKEVFEHCVDLQTLNPEDLVIYARDVGQCVALACWFAQVPLRSTCAKEALSGSVSAPWLTQTKTVPCHPSSLIRFSLRGSGTGILAVQSPPLVVDFSSTSFGSTKAPRVAWTCILTILVKPATVGRGIPAAPPILEIIARFDAEGGREQDLPVFRRYLGHYVGFPTRGLNFQASRPCEPTNTSSSAATRVDRRRRTRPSIPSDSENGPAINFLVTNAADKEALDRTPENLQERVETNFARGVRTKSAILAFCNWAGVGGDDSKHSTWYGDSKRNCLVDKGDVAAGPHCHRVEGIVWVYITSDPTSACSRPPAWLCLATASVRQVGATDPHMGPYKAQTALDQSDEDGGVNSHTVLN
ncbi:hypothetical protein BKA70DRAFT_1232269 [Coprinopsis sp. MPI-PUGE-AT-0042]|nr:hypothetical protein BKA70DRAFT_1232269 [Coprinopsis sp. MPI-PUGE-AT-0042]